MSFENAIAPVCRLRSLLTMSLQNIATELYVAGDIGKSYVFDVLNFNIGILAIYKLFDVWRYFFPQYSYKFRVHKIVLIRDIQAHNLYIVEVLFKFF